jgi:hypothetical protein
MFAVPNKKKCVKDGAFAERASAIVCGTDHGQVLCFFYCIIHPNADLDGCGENGRSSGYWCRYDGICFQKITEHPEQTTTTPEAHIIACGSSAETSEITVWEKPVRG